MSDAVASRSQEKARDSKPDAMGIAVIIIISFSFFSL
jgi:hypothetical protein